MSLLLHYLRRVRVGFGGWNLPMSDWCFFACGWSSHVSLVIFGEFWESLARIRHGNPLLPWQDFYTEKNIHVQQICWCVLYLKIHDTCGQICAKSMDCWGSFSQVPIPADSWYPGVWTEGIHGSSQHGNFWKSPLKRYWKKNSSFNPVEKMSQVGVKIKNAWNHYLGYFNVALLFAWLVWLVR